MSNIAGERPLVDKKAEKFCQFILEGKTQGEAHSLIGFKRHSGNACRYAKRSDVVERLSHLRSLKEAKADQVAEDENKIVLEQIESAGTLTRKAVLQKLEHLYQVAIGAKRITMSKRNRKTDEITMVEQSVPHLPTAKACIELMGKQVGMWNEKVGLLDVDDPDNQLKAPRGLDDEAILRFAEHVAAKKTANGGNA